MTIDCTKCARWQGRCGMRTQSFNFCRDRDYALFVPNPQTYMVALPDIVARQIEWSLKTFGPGRRTQGLLDHLQKELAEIAAAPTDLKEWVDVIILAMDGAWRAGHTPMDIARALIEKQEENRNRQWPDWRTAEPGKAIEHIRS